MKFSTCCLIRPLAAQSGRIKWMNEVANSDCQYIPTPVEHIFNIFTHGLFIPLSILGGLCLVKESHSQEHLFVAIVYGSALIFIFTISTFFHITAYYNCDRKLCDIFHRGDRAMIYIFIAASYFPWLTLCPLLQKNGLVSHLWWSIWLFALLGIAYQQLFHGKYKSLETIFYVFFGVVPAVFILKTVTFAGLEELKIGGLLYILGILFFKSDGKIPCAHAIWHLFVAYAAGVHFYAIYRHLFLSNDC